jgi:hypothetical protein
MPRKKSGKKKGAAHGFPGSESISQPKDPSCGHHHFDPDGERTGLGKDFEQNNHRSRFGACADSHEPHFHRGRLPQDKGNQKGEMKPPTAKRQGGDTVWLQVLIRKRTGKAPPIFVLGAEQTQVFPRKHLLMAALSMLKGAASSAKNAASSNTKNEPEWSRHQARAFPSLFISKKTKANKKARGVIPEGLGFFQELPSDVRKQVRENVFPA